MNTGRTGSYSLVSRGLGEPLFRITFIEHGYTFVAKATIADCVRALKREERVYHHLQSLQGTQVPVYLGAIDLRDIDQIYFDNLSGDHLIYFTLLSWGGCALYEYDRWGRKEISQQVSLLLQAMEDHGVEHGDVRDANILWDEKAGRAMMIDFDRAVLDKDRPPELQEYYLNKRRRRENK
jgi:tRNA A-37 threonylcarbamoyl transferase component Bud32